MRCRVPGKGFDVIHFKRQVREIGSNLDRAALVEFTDLDLDIASRRGKEDELRPAWALGTASHFETQNLFVKMDCFF